MKKKKILLIDDEKKILDLYCRKLGKEGFEVECIDNGSGALKFAKKFKPDLVLLDIMMKDVDGYQVIKKFKTKKDTRDVPIVMLSNLGHGEAIEKGILSGADDFIVKINYTPEEVVEKVRMFFKK